YFTINDGSNLPKVFEFDKNGTTVTNTVPINISGSPTFSQVVTAIQNAINGAGLLTSATGNTVTGTIDLTNASTLDVSGSLGLLKSPNILRIVGNGGIDGDVLTPSDANPYLLGINNGGATLTDGVSFT